MAVTDNPEALTTQGVSKRGNFLIHPSNIQPQRHIDPHDPARQFPRVLHRFGENDGKRVENADELALALQDGWCLTPQFAPPAAVEPVLDESTDEAPVARKKPGPKPKPVAA